MAANQNSLDDPIGVGIRYPIEFKDGGMRLTAENLAFVRNQEGIGDPRVNGVQRLVATNEEKRAVVRQSMRRIAKSRRGDRFMEGQCGNLADLVVFEPNDAVSQQVAMFYLTSAIAEQEARVALLDSFAQPGDGPGEEIVIEIFATYKILNTDVVTQDTILERSITA